MRLRHAASLVVLAAATMVSAAPPAEAVKAKSASSAIRFPDVTPAPAPNPPRPDPGAIPRLTADTLYVVSADSEWLVFASPPELVNLTKDVGPLRIRGKFIDGTGKTETREYKGKSVVTVEAAGTGRVDLWFVPVGATKESDAIRKTVDVDSGQGPIPPPKPDPDPIPDPKPKPTPVVGPLWVIVVEETSQRTPDIARVLADLTYWRTIKSRGHSWRHYDKDAAEAVSQGYTKQAATVGLPAILVLDRDGDPVRVVPLPKTTAEIDKIIQEISK